MYFLHTYIWVSYGSDGLPRLRFGFKSVPFISSFWDQWLFFFHSGLEKHKRANQSLQVHLKFLLSSNSFWNECEETTYLAKPTIKVAGKYISICSSEREYLKIDMAKGMNVYFYYRKEMKGCKDNPFYHIYS